MDFQLQIKFNNFHGRAIATSKIITILQHFPLPWKMQKKFPGHYTQHMVWEPVNINRNYSHSNHLVCTVILCYFLANNEHSLIPLHFLIHSHVQCISNCHLQPKHVQQAMSSTLHSGTPWTVTLQSDNPQFRGKFWRIGAVIKNQRPTSGWRVNGVSPHQKSTNSMRDEKEKTFFSVCAYRCRQTNRHTDNRQTNRVDDWK